MKRISILALLMTLFCLQLRAQYVTENNRFAESIWSMQKKAAVLRYMTLTEAEKAAFWPIYESYTRAIQYLEMEQMQLLQDYSNFNNVTPKEQENLSTRIMNNDIMLAKVRKVYFKKFKKALSPDLASRFMQFDHSFRSVLHYEIEKDLPPMQVIQGAVYSKKN